MNIGYSDLHTKQHISSTATLHMKQQDMGRSPPLLNTYLDIQQYFWTCTWAAQQWQ